MQINPAGAAPLQANKTNGKTPSVTGEDPAKRSVVSETDAEWAEKTVDDKLSLSEQSLQRAKSDVNGYGAAAIADREQAKSVLARLIQDFKNEPGTAAALYRTITPETVESLLV